MSAIKIYSQKFSVKELNKLSMYAALGYVNSKQLKKDRTIVEKFLKAAEKLGAK